MRASDIIMRFIPGGKWAIGFEVTPSQPCRLDQGGRDNSPNHMSKSFPLTQFQTCFSPRLEMPVLQIITRRENDELGKEKLVG